jgi:hypothetical protein
MKLIIDNSPQRHEKPIAIAIKKAMVEGLLSRFSYSDKIEMVELFFKKMEADEQARRVLKQQKKPAANDCTIGTIAVSMSEEYPEHKKTH